MAFWFSRERKGSEWQRGWKGSLLDSITLPPMPFIFIFAITIFFLSLSTYSNYTTQVNHTMDQLNLLWFVLPLLLILLVRTVTKNGSLVLRLPYPERDSIHRAGGSPWGVALLVLLLLLMVSFQSTFYSKWYRPLWGRY